MQSSFRTRWGAGSVSTVIQEYLSNPRQHVVVQPDERDVMFGGYTQLMKNKQACNLHFTAIDHILTEEDVPAILQTLNGKPDCLVVDCEDCLRSEIEKNPSLFTDVKQIQVERDDKNANYDQLFREHGFEKVDSYYGCGVEEPTPYHIENGMLCTTEAWERNQ